METGNQQDSMSSTTSKKSRSVKIRATLSPFSSPVASTEATATIVLYMHDRMLADAPASLVGSAEVTFADGVEGGNKACVVIEPNLEEAEQIGKHWHEMEEPSLYVSIDMSNGTVWLNDGGPAFGVQPGD